MQISPINLNPTIKSNLKHNNNVSGYSAFKYNKVFSFKGSQITPLTDKDYEKAMKNLPIAINVAQRRTGNNIIKLSELDLKPINGLQKDIPVFEGLTMQEIGYIFTRPAILLNRGCHNMCTHCVYMATPYSNQTLDKMSFEDFESLINGISTLQERLGDKVKVTKSLGTYLDADCIDIELRDKNGKVYDYIDCLNHFASIGTNDVFDTSGWTPTSKKHQERAEKFVDYITKSENIDKVKCVNISINPFHALMVESEKAKKNGDLEKAEKIEQKYVERMANVLFTFTPILNSKVRMEIIARDINDEDSLSDLNATTQTRLISKILDQLKEMYKNDFKGEQKYINNRYKLNKYLKKYQNLFDKVGDFITKIKPVGRAEALFISPDTTVKERKESLLKILNYNQDFLISYTAINPNGSIITIYDDVAVKTDLELNFENKGKLVKPFANEIDDYVFKPSEKPTSNLPFYFKKLDK